MTHAGIRTETISYWLETLELHFQPAVIRRGYEYAAQGRVVSVQIENDVLRAYVQGTEGRMYAVKLDAEFFGISTCSCPYEAYCKHMSAVIFQACKMAGLNLHAVAAELLIPPDAARRTAKREAAAGRERAVREALASQAAKRQAGDTLSPHAAAEEWRRWVAARADRSKSGAALAHLRDTLTGAAQRATAGWPEQPALLFELYIEMALLHTADQLARKFDVLYSVSYNGPSIESLVQAGIRRIGQLCERLDGGVVRASHPDHVKLIQEELGNHPFDLSVSNIDWLLIYRLLWSTALNDPRWVRTERVRIADMLKDARIIAHKRELLQCAQAHFHLLSGEDGKARAIIAGLELYRSPDKWLFYPERFRLAHDWSRLIDWLRWLLPQIETGADRGQLQRYLLLWQQAAAHTDSEREWRSVLQRLLPASFEQYEDYLIGRGAFALWADLMMTLGISAANISRERLAQAEAAEPQAVLPLLHQAVDYHIARKNRDDYRLAVKWLKQLEQTYRRMERVAVWQEFFARLRTRTHRLRSFQEELKKGGLRA